MYKNKYPIFLASLGRYDSKQGKGIVLLEKYDIEYYLVISDFERDKYLEFVRSLNPSFPEDHILISPTGIGRVRQFTLDAARAMGAENYWMFDDDVSNIRNAKRQVIAPQEAIEYLEHRIDTEPKIGSIALQYSNVLWRVTGTEIVNNQCTGIVVLHRANVPWNWDLRLNNSEETDWAYKFVLNGYDIVIDNTHTLDTQPIGRFAGKVGGVPYNAEGMKKAAAIFTEKYGPDVFRVDQLNSDNMHFTRRWAKLRQLRDSGKADLAKINAVYS